jgi:hypothetical protein
MRKFQTKTINELSSYELLNLRKLSLTYGVFRSIVKNLKNGKVNNPELINVTICKHGFEYVGWLLEDCGGEYDKVREIPGTCAIHIYTAPQHRMTGTGLALIENRLTELQKHATVFAYVFEDDAEAKFFNKVREKLSLNLEIKTPIYYMEYKVERRRKTKNG